MYFNDNIAKKYGFAEAILLQSIYNWCSYRKRNNKNNFDNRFWMFNTIKEFLDELPYLKNFNTIRTACLRVMLFQIPLKPNLKLNGLKACLRVMLFQIPLKLPFLM